MKKLFFTFAMLLGSLSFLYSQTTPEDIFKTFGSEENAQLMTLDGDMLSAMKAQAGEDADKLEGIEAITVLDISQCDQSAKDEFEKATGSMQLDGYETLVRVNEEGVTARIMGKVEGDIVRDMIVVVTGEAHVLVQMKGSINMSDVNSMMQF